MEIINIIMNIAVIPLILVSCILVLMEYTDRHTYLSEYFHYNIKNNKLIQVDSDTDDYYRELFEDCHMLDCLDSFFIMGIDENCKLLYGNKYNNNIVSL